MFTSRARLHDDIGTLLEAIRLTAGGRYACVLDPRAILFETPEPEEREIATLRRLLDLGAKAIFALPAQVSSADAGPDADPFEGWEHDDLLLAFLNRRVAVVLACADAEAARDKIMPPLQALVDRLLRYDAGY